MSQVLINNFLRYQLIAFFTNTGHKCHTARESLPALGGPMRMAWPAWGETFIDLGH